ncbi:hypothetical protein [Bradyrhizobium sp. LA7.1]|uniref:hypothetical protein n=1 Tax=Bradyrhizobium sp. LA7.1 TaxID=3156324 RepID=UPI003396BF88
MQRRPVSGHFLNVVVDRLHQLLAIAAAAGLPAEYQVAAQAVELDEVCLTRSASASSSSLRIRS